MDARRSELTIDDVMADPVIGAAMKADGIDPRAFRDLLDRARDARAKRARCLDVPFSRPRDARPDPRPWARVTPPAATRDCCGASRAW